MGGTQSKATITSLNDILTEVASKTVQDCVVSSQQDQVTEIGTGGWFSWGVDVNIEQATEVDFQCSSMSQKIVDLQNQIVNTIINSTTASGIALFSALGRTKAEAQSNLTTRIKSSVTMENIQKTYIEIKQKQTTKVNINTQIVLDFDINVKQGAKIFATSVITELNKTGVYNDIANYIDQKSKAEEENPLEVFVRAIKAIGDSIGGAIGSISMAIIGLILLVVLIMAGTTYLIFA